MKKKDKIQGYLNEIKPQFNQSGDTLTMSLYIKEEKVGEMKFSVHIIKGTLKPISQRVIQLTDVDTLKLIEGINQIVPLKERDVKLVRKEILNYSRDRVNEYYL